MDRADEILTVKMGKWTDDSVTALSECVEMGKTQGGRNYFHGSSGKSMHDCFLCAILVVTAVFTLAVCNGGCSKL